MSLRGGASNRVAHEYRTVGPEDTADLEPPIPKDVQRQSNVTAIERRKWQSPMKLNW